MDSASLVDELLVGVMTEELKGVKQVECGGVAGDSNAV